MPTDGAGVESPFSHLPYRPCVGVMLVRADDKIFAGERTDFAKAWQMPQGGIEEGEDPRTAALRELQEETGVASSLVKIEGETQGWYPYDLPVELVPKLWNGKFRGQKQKWFKMRFNGADADVNIVQPHQEFGRWRWMDPDQLLDAIVPFKRALYSKVLAELGHGRS